jgi:hypothetical protein
MIIGLSSKRLSNLTLGLIGTSGAFYAPNFFAGVIEFPFFLSSSKLSSPRPSLCNY